MTLTIISHTEHYIGSDGRVVGWGPTITEINHLLAVFDTITHVAMLQPEEAPPSALPYVSDRIKFVALPPLGGKRFVDKLRLLTHAPRVLRTVAYWIQQSDYFTLRTPTGIGVYLIPYLTLAVNTKGWYKYAGNWQQKNPPLGYALQRQLLKWQSRKVTINGFWDEQPTHCLSFENPCLTEADLAIGIEIRRLKHFKSPLSICFVGRLEKEKGVERLIQSLQALPVSLQERIAGVHMVGDGVDRPYFESLTLSSIIPFTFHGFLPREAVHAIYKLSHVFILPTTASEGFPKVLAEAMNYGCIPIVSDLSAISHYIEHGQQGLLLNPVTVVSLTEALTTFFNLDAATYEHMLASQEAVVKNFTFAHYHEHLRTELLS